MTRANVVDETLTALLAGRRPAEGDELASELAWMIEQVNNVYPLPVVSEHVEDTHLVRMMEAARALPMPVTAPSPLVQASPFTRLRAGLSRKVAAATLSFTAAFGGAAYAGVLPGPVQAAVSNAAALVGLELPNPFDDDADQDSPELEGVGDDYQPPVDAVDSGPRSDSGHGSDNDGLESDGDDPDQEGDDDGHAGNGAASDDDNGQLDRDEPDSDEPDGGEEPDTDEPDGGEEPDSDEPDGGDEPESDEPDGGDEPESDEPDGGDSSGTQGGDIDSPDEFDGPRVPGSASDDESASEL